MKQAFFILLTLLTLKAHAQLNLSFDKRFVECEDQWVAFKMNKDSTYTYGFIYIDSEAGLTFNNEGSFKRKEDGTFVIEKIEDTSIKVRLEPNKVKVAIIPESMFADLKIEKEPEWLKYYKTDLNTAKRQYRFGFMYNGWNECAKALPFLLKAKELDPDFEGLAVEIAFSYNCLEEYEKAVAILEDAIETNPTDAYINKEYIYSLTKMKAIDKAVAQFHKSTKLVKENTYNAESCFNILHYYYTQNDKKNFKIWYNELKKWPNKNERLTQYVDQMKSEMK